MVADYLIRTDLHTARSEANGWTVPDYSHLTGDWLTVARMHAAVMADESLESFDRKVSRAALYSLLARYEMEPDLIFVRLYLEAPRQKGKPHPEKPKRKPAARRKTTDRKRGPIPGSEAAKRPQIMVPPPGLDRPVITLKQAADRAGVSIVTARRYVMAGTWEAFQVKAKNGMWWVYADQPGLMD